MKNLITRTLTAVVFCFVVLYSMMDGLGLCGLLFGLFAALGLREFYQLGAKADAGKPFQLLGIITGMMLYTLTYGVFANWWGVGQLAWLVFPVIAGSASWLLSKKSFPFADLSLTWLGVIYVVFPFVLIPALGGVSGGYDYTIPLGVILLVWANDTGAYLVGSAIGKHKLIERLSPGKTWEGLAGAIVLTLVSAWILEEYLLGSIEASWYIIALLCSIFSTLGDLFESRMKRLAKVKDSGTLMPGHGGVLDRFDGLLFVIPMVYAYVVLIN